MSRFLVPKKIPNYNSTLYEQDSQTIYERSWKILTQNIPKSKKIGMSMQRAQLDIYFLMLKELTQPKFHIIR